ncbi:transmembrane protein 132C [Rhinolophus ferrumequinum]|uniref:Transmembrane protein 132C n=1 Tax=Rhinolophus ferrumequinum TaxID=59479 RepID=A0A671FXI2_RHIFE|nr:transmembrane protein 132C [Rhinolophus ferrumequinum]KAF6278644.1 transmembrane protein 132C [Rhinolophus ferrumequinum]
MRSEGAAPRPVAPLCGALSLVLGALLGKVIEGRGVADTIQRVSSLPPYLPASFHVLRAETAFFLRETRQDAAHNSSLQSRVESFFTYRAKRPPILNTSYGPFTVEKVVPLDLMLVSNFLGPTSKFSFNWKLKAHILRDRVYPDRPTVQVLFHVVGRDWAERSPGEQLPCLRVFAFRETREVRGGCRLRGDLGLCVAQLQLLASWFSAPAVLAGRKRPAEPAEGSAVELYYAVHAGDERGDCAGGDVRKGNAIRPGKDGLEDSTSHLQRIGSVGLYRAQDSAAQLRELRLDGNVAVWLPSRPVKQGEVVTAYVTVASSSTVDFFILRAKVKKGVNILSTRPSEPRQWDAKQELGNGGKHATTTVLCQRLGPSARNRSSSSFNEVVQMNFEIASFSSLSGTQPITWQVEYPRKGTTDIAVSEIFISQKDLVGIVPLAMDTEILNTAILTGQTVSLPVKVVSVEENGAVTDISESVECKATDEDVIKVSDRCDYVFVNGKEMKGKVDAVVNFTYQYLSAPLHVTVWVPRLPLQIEVSDTELSQIKGWRVPIMASKRPTRESEDDEDEERRGRGCALQYQHATVRVLTQFVSEGAGPWGQLSHLLGPDWQVDISHLVAGFMKLEEPHVASLQDSRILVGREVGMTTIQVLSPLSDSILAEKTVTVLDDKVSVTDLAIQLVAGLSVTLHPSAENSKAITAVATAEELLRAPKQEAVVSTWLQFSDGSVTPLDIYDPKDFTLTATSLDEAVVSVPQARSPRWPVVVAEGAGQGPLVRVDLTIAEACQKSKRKSVLAVGVGNVRVKFGPSDADSSPGGGDDNDDDEGDIKNHASDRRQKGPDPERAGQDGQLQGSSSAEREEGSLRRGSPTARPLLDNKAPKDSRQDGGRPPAEGRLQTIPIDFSNFPAHVDLPQAGAGLGDSGLEPAARGLSDLEVGMYALLGVFCLAILVFLINCTTFALKYRHKQLPLEGQASVSHSHDWVWLGNEAELLENAGEGPPPPEEHTTVIDRGPGGCEESNRLLLNGGSQKHVQGQIHRPAEAGARPGRDPKLEPLHSPTSKRKKVKFTTFTTIPLDDSCPTVNAILGANDEDIKWVCQDLDVGAPKELRNYLEKFKDKV